MSNLCTPQKGRVRSTPGEPKSPATSYIFQKLQQKPYEYNVAQMLEELGFSSGEWQDARINIEIIRDNIVEAQRTELCLNDDQNYYNVPRNIQMEIKKTSIQQYLQSQPHWLLRWEQNNPSALEQQPGIIPATKGRTFIQQIFSHRLSILWSNLVSYRNTGSTKRKASKLEEDDSMNKNCSSCSRTMELVYRCPEGCKVEHESNKKLRVTTVSKGTNTEEVSDKEPLNDEGDKDSETITPDIPRSPSVSSPPSSTTGRQNEDTSPQPTVIESSRSLREIVDLTEHDPDSGDDDPLEDNPLTESFEFGSAFEKVAEFEKYLDGPNPWDPDFAVKLFPCQIIGFRWMCSRHSKGGGLVADKVGLGKTLQSVSFIKWLSNQISNDDTSERRNLCLVVMHNKNLIPGWLKTLNNDTTPSKHDYMWQTEKGLRVYDGTKPRSKPPLKDGVLSGCDVALVLASQLSTNPSGPLPWFTAVRWHTIIADEAHDFLRGQHNKAGHRPPSNTLIHWGRLQQKTNSIFLLTGTPFITNIPYDFTAITKAIAPEFKRKSWSSDCTDEGLDALRREWIQDTSGKNMQLIEQQKHLADKMAQLLAIYTLRRDAKSVIRGVPVMEDYLGKCVTLDDPLPFNGTEYNRTKQLYQQTWGMLRSVNNQFNDRMRCLVWSHRYVRWKGAAKNRAIAWDSYTLQEARTESSRAAAVIDQLLHCKANDEGVLLFYSRIFVGEWALKICQLLGLRTGFIGPKDAIMLGHHYTGDEQDNFITMCQKGGLDVCVLSVTSAKNGANLQGMSVGICLNVLTAGGVVEQCKGRYNRYGQTKATMWREIWIRGEVQDDVFRLMREQRIGESQALTTIRSRQKKDRQKRGGSASDDDFVL